MVTEIKIKIIWILMKRVNIHIKSNKIILVMDQIKNIFNNMEIKSIMTHNDNNNYLQ